MSSEPPRGRTATANLAALGSTFAPWTPASLQGDLDQFINEGARLRDRLVEVEIHIMALERLLGKGS